MEEVGSKENSSPSGLPIHHGYHYWMNSPHSKWNMNFKHVRKPRKSSLYRRRSLGYLHRKLIINFMKPNPLFTKLMSTEEFLGGTYLLDTFIYDGYENPKML